jgi:uncharacterized membrane protein YoaK (UPF0700 family)
VVTTSYTLRFAVLLIAANGFLDAHTYITRGGVFANVHLAANQMGLFRLVGDLPYMPIATTDNLMRFIEAGYTGFIDHQSSSRKAFRIYGLLTVTFAVGASASYTWGVRAIWVPGALLAFTLVLFVFDQRKGHRTVAPYLLHTGEIRSSVTAWGGTAPLVMAPVVVVSVCAHRSRAV